MGALLLAGAMILGGALLTAVIYNATEEEYPFLYWAGWAVAIGGALLFIAHFSPLRSGYVLWSSLLGLLLLATFLVGRIEDEYLPTAWIGLAILGSNLVVLLAGNWVPSSELVWLFLALGALLLAAGYSLRRSDYDFYDAAYCAGVICLVLVQISSMGPLRTRLEQLNIVVIPALNTNVEVARARLSSYSQALEQAQQYRAQIASEFADNSATYLTMVDDSIQAAAQEHDAAAPLVAALQPAEPAAAYSPELEQQLLAQTEQARSAVARTQAALDQLAEVPQLFQTLSSEWLKEYLWFEVDGYWTSEENDYPSYNVCYYGERLSTRSGDSISEEIISDDADRTGMADASTSDIAGVNWKFFTVADYQDFVNSGLIEAAPRVIDSDEEAGSYLCGRSPQSGQYGALGEPPVQIEKAYGSLTREVGDEGAAFVGDYRYGSWCVPAAQGEPQVIPEGQQPPPDAQWCWYQKPGSSTGYYWYRSGSPGSYIWVQGHRRCVYCNPTASWSGGQLVPDRRLAEINGTEGSSVRGPADQGGGPGTGK